MYHLFNGENMIVLKISNFTIPHNTFNFVEKWMLNYFDVSCVFKAGDSRNMLLSKLLNKSLPLTMNAIYVVQTKECLFQQCSKSMFRFIDI